MFKSGFIVLVGRPNVGKSTLINALVGAKVSICSNVSQTTRTRIRAIYNSDKMQAIFVDTPGLHKPYDVLGQELNESTHLALADADLTIMLLDSTKELGSGDKWVTNQIKTKNKICLITKSDISCDTTEHIEEAKKLSDWNSVFDVSAKENRNLDKLLNIIYELLPEGPAWFSKDTTTDQPTEIILAEYIREKILHNVYDEIPHSIGVEVDSIEEGKKLCKIYASIYVEKKSQKSIVIGKNGSMLKKIGTLAREDIEKLYEKKVYLDLSVRLKKDWRRDYNQVRRFGYSAE